MAYSLTKNSDGDLSLGNIRGELVTLAPAASDYATGGYLIQGGTNGDIGLTKVLAAIPIGGQQGIAPVFNPSTSKVQMFGTAAAAGILLALGPVSTGVSTTVGVTSGLITVAQPNSLVKGQFVLYTSTGAGAAFSGQILEVASATASQWTANFPTPNITAATADVTITYQLIQVQNQPANLLQEGTSYAITNSLATSSLLTMTITNPPAGGGHTLVPGDFVIIGGASGNLTNGANSNGVIVRVLTASATQFTATWTGTSFTSAADTGTARLLVTNGAAPIMAEYNTVVTNSVATASSAGTAGVLTLTAANSFVPGNIFQVAGLTNGAAVNGDVLVVISTSLTNAALKANGKMAAITTGADAGAISLLETGSPTATPGSTELELPAGTDLSSLSFQFLVIGY